MRNILILAALSSALGAGTAEVRAESEAPPPAAAPSTQPASDVKELIRRLGDDDFRVRQTAAEALRKMGKDAIPALREARKSADPEVQTRAAQILSDLEKPPALPVPHAGAGGSHSFRVSITNGVKRIDVTEPGRTTHIDENAGGITMTVTGEIDGKQVTREYKAKSAEQLKKENPDAFDLYQKYAGNGGIGQIQIQGAGGGIVLHGNVQINGGGAINIVPNPALVRPAVPNRPPLPGGDNLEQLEAKIGDEMQAANLPDARQEEVKELLKQLRDALPQADKGDKDVDGQMREYNRRCDALRQKLAELKLADPGDALPPPLSARLGISATEEAVAGEGLVVTHVLPDSRAARIGLKEQDVIQKVNGQAVHSTHDLRKLVTGNQKGLVIEGLRDGKPLKLEEPAGK